MKRKNDPDSSYLNRSEIESWVIGFFLHINIHCILYTFFVSFRSFVVVFAVAVAAAADADGSDFLQADANLKLNKKKKLKTNLVDDLREKVSFGKIFFFHFVCLFDV